MLCLRRAPRCARRGAVRGVPEGAQAAGGRRHGRRRRGTVPEESDVTALEATSELEEIDIDVDEDIPSNEYSEIHKELGMDDDWRTRKWPRTTSPRTSAEVRTGKGA